MSVDGINWNFIPPRSPHFGGLWESSVKLMKYHLRRVLGNLVLTFEELSTVITQIVACINSRPLSPMSENPSDLNPLTPGHFLIGDSLMALPQRDLREVNTPRLSRYQHLTQLVQHFWDRWSKEYLTNLQQRSKWKFANSNPLKVGDMVVLREDNLPPLKWSLGRIEVMHPGTDGIIRVVTIKTPKGSVRRAVTKICVLPMNN